MIKDNHCILTDPPGCMNNSDANSIEIDVCEDHTVYITIDKPWDGDSINGFGVVCSMSLTAEQAHELAAFLWSRC